MGDRLAEIRAREEKRRSPHGIVSALRDLTDGVSTLVRQHLELVRLEVSEDARIMGGHLAVVALFGSITLVGYILLNASAVLFAGWGFGIHGMAITTLVLAIINLGLGARALSASLKRLKAEGIALDRTVDELERNIEWVKEIKEKS